MSLLTTAVFSLNMMFYQFYDTSMFYQFPHAPASIFALWDSEGKTNWSKNSIKFRRKSAITYRQHASVKRPDSHWFIDSRRQKREEEVEEIKSEEEEYKETSERVKLKEEESEDGKRIK